MRLSSGIENASLPCPARTLSFPLSCGSFSTVGTFPTFSFSTCVILALAFALPLLCTWLLLSPGPAPRDTSFFGCGCWLGLVLTFLSRFLGPCHFHCLCLFLLSTQLQARPGRQARRQHVNWIMPMWCLEAKYLSDCLVKQVSWVSVFHCFLKTLFL